MVIVLAPDPNARLIAAGFRVPGAKDGLRSGIPPIVSTLGNSLVWLNGAARVDEFERRINHKRQGG